MMSPEDKLDLIKILHSEYGLYFECDCTNEDGSHEEGRVVVDIDDIGDTCADPYKTVCRECHTDDGECNEDTEYGLWPCDTMKIVLQGEKE